MARIDPSLSIVGNFYLVVATSDLLQYRYYHIEMMNDSKRWNDTGNWTLLVLKFVVVDVEDSRVHLCVYVRKYECVYVRKYECMYIRMYECVHVYVYLCTGVTRMTSVSVTPSGSNKPATTW